MKKNLIFGSMALVAAVAVVGGFFHTMSTPPEPLFLFSLFGQF